MVDYGSHILVIVETFSCFLSFQIQQIASFSRNQQKFWLILTCLNHVILFKQVSISLIHDFQMARSRTIVLKGDFDIFPLALQFEEEIDYRNWIDGLNILLKQETFEPEIVKIIRRLTEVQMNLNAITALAK